MNYVNIFVMVVNGISWEFSWNWMLRSLEDIHKLPDDSIYKTTKMFELWLDTKPDATRRQVIDTLRKEEITVAHEYELTLWKFCSLSTSKYRNLLHVHLVINVILLVCLWTVCHFYYRNGYSRYWSKCYLCQ